MVFSCQNAAPPTIQIRSKRNIYNVYLPSLSAATLLTRPRRLLLNNNNFIKRKGKGRKKKNTAENGLARGLQRPRTRFVAMRKAQRFAFVRAAVGRIAIITSTQPPGGGGRRSYVSIWGGKNRGVENFHWFRFSFFILKTIENHWKLSRPFGYAWYGTVA